MMVKYSSFHLFNCALFCVLRCLIRAHLSGKGISTPSNIQLSLGGNDIMTCRSYCVESASKPASFQFCQCGISLSWDHRKSLLRISGVKAVVYIRKWPVGDNLCGRLCKSLKACASIDYIKSGNVCRLNSNYTSNAVGTTKLVTIPATRLKTSVGYETTHFRSTRPPLTEVQEKTDGGAHTTPGAALTSLSSITTTDIETGVGTSSLEPVTSQETTSGATPTVTQAITSTQRMRCEDYCTKPNRTCFQNKCICRRGYVEQPGNVECLKNCRFFSKEFTLQSESFCSRKFYENYTNLGVDECSAKCTSIHEEAFCPAFQIKNNYCYIIKRLEQWPVKDWERGDCRFYQRNCEEQIVETCKDCHSKNRNCLGSKCDCKVGYHRALGYQEQCLSACPLYDTEFDLQSNRICINRMTYTFYDEAKNCRRLCLELDSKVCRAYETYLNHCYLLTEANLYDSGRVPEDWTECGHYQRRCKPCDAACKPPNYSCDPDGLCQCARGYNPTPDGKCTKDCKTFTETFTASWFKTRQCFQRHLATVRYRISRGHCVQKCIRSSHACASFEYEDSLCYIFGWRRLPLVDRNWVNRPNCGHYVRYCVNQVKECTPPCKSPNYFCYHGSCTCALGYSRTLDGKCVKGCQYFSTKFELQDFKVCYSRGHEEEYSGIYYSGECRELCQKAKYTCWAYQVLDGMCYTYRWKEMLFQPEFHRYAYDCQQYIRSCQQKGPPDACDPCNKPNYRCVNNTCICNIGYSRVKDLGTCVKECPRFTKTFTKQTTSFCTKGYRKDHKGVGSVSGCSKICIGERSFPCAAFVVYGGHCYTLEWKHMYMQWQWFRECQHYTRDCQPVCEKGFSLTPGRNHCVQNCHSYSDEFQKQSSHACLTKATNQLGPLGRDECGKRCVHTTDFVCEGFELYQGDCYLVSEDREEYAEWTEFDACQHHQRVCES